MKSFFGFGSAAPSGKAEAPAPAEEARDGEAAPGPDDGVGSNAADRKSLFSTLAGLKGKDPQSLLSLPPSFFEPLSVIQRMSEMLHFSELLDEAARCENSLDALTFVSVFAVTNYNSVERFYKPFNPILGETFEFVDQSKGVKLVAEQVSHHPPISAVHCEGNDWTFWQEGRTKTKFLGNSIEIYPNSKTHIFFPKTGDHFSFTETPTTCVNNLIFGRSWIEHYGTFTIKNLRTGDVCSLTFEKSGWFGSGGKHVVHGEVQSAAGKPHVKLSGKWSVAVEAEWVAKNKKQCEARGTKKEVWRRPANNSIGKYRFTEFTPRLNEMATDEPALQGISYADLLPRTDARIRPDRAALERGDNAAASRLKHLMEERQRADRKQRAADDAAYIPQWFVCLKDDDGRGGRDSEGKPVAATAATAGAGAEVEAAADADDVWVYRGDYWEQRQARLQWLADRHSKEAESLDAATAAAPADAGAARKGRGKGKGKGKGKSGKSGKAEVDDAPTSQHDDGDDDDAPESQNAADSDGVAQDTDADDEDAAEPLGVPSLVDSAADFRSYTE